MVAAPLLGAARFELEFELLRAQSSTDTKLQQFIHCKLTGQNLQSRTRNSPHKLP